MAVACIIQQVTDVSCHRYQKCSVAQLCPTLRGPTDCNSPGSSVHGMFQARIWSGLPFPTPEDLPDQELNLCLLSLLYWHVDSLPPMPPGKPTCVEKCSHIF